MSTVKWLVVRCQMYLVRLPDRKMGTLLNESFGNLVVETSTLHIAQQANSHLRLGDHVYWVKLSCHPLRQGGCQGLNTYAGADVFCPFSQQLARKFGRYGLVMLLLPAGSDPAFAGPLIRASTRSRACSI